MKTTVSYYPTTDSVVFQGAPRTISSLRSYNESDETEPIAVREWDGWPLSPLWMPLPVLGETLETGFTLLELRRAADRFLRAHKITRCDVCENYSSLAQTPCPTCVMEDSLSRQYPDRFTMPVLARTWRGGAQPTAARDKYIVLCACRRPTRRDNWIWGVIEGGVTGYEWYEFPIVEALKILDHDKSRMWCLCAGHQGESPALYITEAALRPFLLAAQLHIQGGGRCPIPTTERLQET